MTNTAEEIVKTLAEKNPFFACDFMCNGCGTNREKPHSKNCPYRMAQEWVKASRICAGCSEPITPEQSSLIRKTTYLAWHLDCSPDEQEDARNKLIAGLIEILCNCNIPARLENVVDAIVNDLVTDNGRDDDIKSRLAICAKVCPELGAALDIVKKL